MFWSYDAYREFDAVNGRKGHGGGFELGGDFELGADFELGGGAE